jgi:hypothetical protein
LVAWGGIEPPTQGFSNLVEVVTHQARAAIVHLQKPDFL